MHLKFILLVIWILIAIRIEVLLCLFFDREFIFYSLSALGVDVSWLKWCSTFMNSNVLQRYLANESGEKRIWKWSKIYFETKVCLFNQRWIVGGETRRKWWLGMSNEDCIPLFSVKRNEDKLKARAFFFMSMANRGKETQMASKGVFSSNELPSTFIKFGYCLRINRVDVVVFLLNNISYVLKG